MSHPLARFDITPQEIDRVVAQFYKRIRAHDVLGPIFIQRLGTTAQVWRPHEAKIAAFWRNAILFEREYSGNPMQVHMQVPAIMPEHFALWLDLFDEVLAEELRPEAARSFSALAHRIGRGLRMGIASVRQPKDQPPVFS
ncbi:MULTISPECIES: group III truncated hemoglobin [Halocynthiibacter]|uniref:Group III truncated hemoglobin n=1 Tax=Halocynthiibacter halioticoli TaxID=2986804 RepID=A0AAE3LR88_9RHOB|nr:MULTISPECIES: group III truncated hemoglobin [Halocynthiibacter]MCV6825312.1 group III truncated hemoglobin [Halocynthiibacter halioticoli]MCW4058313.1 group III truncated hemoglobin [Halocynthiibacter sp. SDUM655004]